MKINKLYFAFLILLTATMVACSEYEDTVEPSPEVSADNPAVRFYSDNATLFEFEPTDELSFELTVVRDHGEEALEVPVTKLADEENVFNVPATVSFPAGVDTVKLTITLDDSTPIGVVYPFELSLDESLSNPYKIEYPFFKGQASIIKWNKLGTVQFYDSFAFSKVTKVTLEQRDDIPEVYRITYPYLENILLDAEWDWIGGAIQDKITFTIKGENVTWDTFWYTNLQYEGTAGKFIKAYLPSAIEEEGDEQSVVVKSEEGEIQYFELYPSFFVDGDGGWGLNAVYLGFPGFDLAGKLEIPVFEN